MDAEVRLERRALLEHFAAASNAAAEHVWGWRGEGMRPATEGMDDEDRAAVAACLNGCSCFRHARRNTRRASTEQNGRRQATHSLLFFDSILSSLVRSLYRRDG